MYLHSLSPVCPSVLFTSMGVFLYYSNIPTSIQFSNRPDFDDSIFYVFKCTTFCCYSALNNAVCWKSMRRSDSFSSEARVLFWFLNGFGGNGVLFFLSDFVQSLTCGVKGCSLSRSRDSPCPRVFHQSALLALNFSQILSTSWPWIVLCPNIDPLKHSKLLPEAQTTSALRHLKCLLQSMPLGRQKRGWESSLVSDGFYLTEYIFHAI